ncbi:DUF3164 family protein [Flavobacterium davisii]|uniref:DUF3164 family protein n=1 Tax=Flavobacterium columnare TaxID=996 RepID=A0A8G0P6G8_9FLAO|nr:DUF3164 family protein [Flavobacterium davisii]QYS89087.1 DUF3164 family protein [Flavobacterium davisii]
MENKVENKSLKELQEDFLRAKRQKQTDYESLRATVVTSLSEKATKLNKEMVEFHILAFKELGTLFELLKEYSERHAQGVGNFTAQEGNYRIKYSRQGQASFDERAAIAEEFIKEFVSNRFKEDTDTHDLIISLLEKKNNDFDINLVQKLYKMEDRFDDKNWRKGIALLKESYNYSLKRDYILFQYRDPSGSWKTLNLNFSNI